MDQIDVEITFKHPWFPPGENVTLWDFFNKFNLEGEKKDQVVNIKKFFTKYVPPLIPQTKQNKQLIAHLMQLTDDFEQCIT